jgi:hypothetical protein
MAFEGSAPTAADQGARNAARGSPINLVQANSQRLTIIHNRSKLPPNFRQLLQAVTITHTDSLVDMAYFNEKKAAPKRGG